ncbi:MAG: anthranilate phosphoribosyltransferase [Omnitrophica WOR_2 bacterium GWF2_38_59]|nr:MAG: anthranilate phosphoribosyltransferase [Omnitrophica WOR_2 bacterium GWA2_37_7]OGX26606.1 MAG: anthranilate phosphoribosyltransferase [Omnitrophica WOR_2 bacterium GWF2_38_59]OGX47731.1 MAG: anthranilate phosphoribosyltransferase [Omnitrophica WOR_2 bacterium RIFOXYA2_FULL_38_17]OGX50421.1 MAG: anthranilate phosphoribosyltransferase [Omnitrophica WOR_2 bacterium RIFOXYA12_FULL_38_10]OGX55770.1 MAG: anthranilate phosphoribosyltransferase [Omnitrophica WOR_2 bacterium RIFOXYB2_FULL_38_16]
MKEHIEKIKDKFSLTREEIEMVMQQIMSGEASKNEVAEFLLALRAKGPTIDEITGAAKIMRKFVVGIETHHRTVLDTCGTGGDKKNTFNISTTAAFVVAGAGVPVAKHGNRSVSSKCGSADVLEAAGINLKIGEQYAGECLDDVGIVFLFAQMHHPSMKYVAPVRKELGVETIFNILGPLTNPAKATHQIMGVYKRDYVEPLANVLKNLGLKKAVVVHGNDGLDEITTTDKTFIAEYNGKEVISYDIDPEEIGISRSKLRDLEGGDLKENLKIFETILDGERGPKRDIVLINAAYALYIADKAKSINEGLSLARESIDSGKARKKLEDLKNFTERIPLVNKGNLN